MGIWMLGREEGVDGQRWKERKAKVNSLQGNKDR